MTLPKKFIVILLAIAALPALGMSPAFAQQATWLTEENIMAFMHETETMYQKPFDEYVTALERVTHDDSLFQAVTIIRTPDKASTEIPVNLDKKALISTARDGYDSMQGAALSQTIDEIAINADKKSATVKSTATITNQKLSPSNALNITLGDSVASCTDNLVYTPMVGVQVIKSQCQLEITVKQEQEL